MADIFPLTGASEGNAPPRLLLERNRDGVPWLLARVRLHSTQEKVVMPAQADSFAAPLPLLLYDDPVGTIRSILDAAPYNELRDLRDINIVCTELSTRRLILADGLPNWRSAASRPVRTPSLPEHLIKTSPIHSHGYLHLHPHHPEEVTACALVSEQDAQALILPTARTVELPDGFHLERFLDRARLFFFVEPLPGRLSPDRVRYLLKHGNDLGPAIVAEIAGHGYLLKARLEVLEALCGGDCGDLAALSVLLERAAHTSLASALPAQEAAPAKLTCWLRPPTLQQVQASALGGGVPLPPFSFSLAHDGLALERVHAA